MEKIVTAVLKDNTYLATEIVHGLVQWDKGQKLKIEGLNLSETVQIHFSLNEYGGIAKRMLGTTNKGVTTVNIPSEILEVEAGGTSYYAYAFVYETDEESAETTHKILLSIKARPKPDDYASTGDKDIVAVFQQQLKSLEEQIANAGKVKTVNEVEPDKDGNIAIDIPETPTNEETLVMLAEADIVNLATDANGDIFTDANGNVIIF